MEMWTSKGLRLKTGEQPTVPKKAYTETCLEQGVQRQKQEQGNILRDKGDQKPGTSDAMSLSSEDDGIEKRELIGFFSSATV